MINSPDVAATLADLQKREVIARIWRKDHTVWKPEPGEIADRLGWLTVTDLMTEQIPALTSFAEEIRNAGFRNVVLLGMGGAALGSEVLRQTFGSAVGYPELIVLDSTVPAWVQAVTESIDPTRTLFLVSSKSGGTIETLSSYKYFRDLVEQAAGKKRAGQNFVAITDPGTPLVKLAGEAEFRRVFLNPADVGGRYSVLSYFGLVPAALMGIDIAALLEQANYMRERCASDVPASENLGALLGVTMATLARHGRDKLTLVTSPSIGSLGLWVEQMLKLNLGSQDKTVFQALQRDYPPQRSFVDARLGDSRFCEGNLTI